MMLSCACERVVHTRQRYIYICMPIFLCDMIVCPGDWYASQYCDVISFHWTCVVFIFRWTTCLLAWTRCALITSPWENQLGDSGWSGVLISRWSLTSLRHTKSTSSNHHPDRVPPDPVRDAHASIFYHVASV